MELRMSNLVAAKGLFVVSAHSYRLTISVQPSVMLFVHHSDQEEWTRWYRLADLSLRCSKDVD